MPEFLVQASIVFPEGTSGQARAQMLTLEANACQPYLDSGQMKRVWRTWGEHDGDHGHLALWDAQDAEHVWAAYGTFPLYVANILSVHTIRALQVNPNDPGTPLEDMPGFPFTWDTFSEVLEAARVLGTDIAMEHGAWVIPGKVSIHCHPESRETPLQVHVMAHDAAGNAQKVAELGPPSGDGEARAPGYVDLLEEWAGMPVAHRQLKARILRDNHLDHPDYNTAVTAQRVRHPVTRY